MDQGYAETTLVTHMRTIIFRALPTPVREFRVRGWQIAWYLEKPWIVLLELLQEINLTHLSIVKATMVNIEV